MNLQSYNQAAAVSELELEDDSSDDMLYRFLADLEELRQAVETIKEKMKQYEEEVNRLKAAMNQAEARYGKKVKELEEEVNKLEAAMNQAEARYDEKVRELARRDEKVKELEDKIKELHAELRQLKETGKKLSLNDDYIYFGAICHKIQDQIMEAMTRDLHLSEEQYQEITGYGIWKIMQFHQDKCLENYFTDSVDIDRFKNNVTKVMAQIKFWHKGKLLHFNASRNEAAHLEVDISVDEIVERIEKSAMEAKDIAVAKSILSIVKNLQRNNII